MGAELLLLLLVLWAVVTVIGHGTWLLFAAIFGAHKPPVVENDLGRPGECPRCHSARGAASGKCPVCGWPRAPGVATNPQAALGELRKQLARLAELEAVDAETYAALQAAIRAQEDRLVEAARQRMPPAPAAAPVEALAEPVAPDLEPVEIVLEPVAPVAAAAATAPPSAAPQPASVAEGIREDASRRVAAREAATVEPPPPPPKQRPALSRLLAAFMEEKNIRWGELVGGLLIVGCSVALVISFWAEIAARPMLKFGLLGGVTAALFGVGLYTDRRWKIHTTSHGILVIATLLVPLNFLAIAAFTQGAAANAATTWIGEAVSVVVFGWLLYLAGRVIVPGMATWLAAGVIVPSIVQLVVRRWAGPDASLAMLYALAAVPIVVYVSCLAGVLRPPQLGEIFEEQHAFRLLRFLGVTSAAAFLPLALLVWKVPPIAEAIHHLSPLVVWCGVPSLVLGLVFWRRGGGWGRGPAEPPAASREPGGPLSLDPSHPVPALSAAVQTAGLSVGVLGAGIMAAAVVAAWPDPATLLPVAAMSFVALSIVAFWFFIPAAHVPAGLMLAAFWLIAIYRWRGDVDWTLESYEPLSRVLVSALSGRLLVPLVAALGVAAETLRRCGRRDDGFMYLLVTVATAVASLALVMWFGFARAGDPEDIVWTLGIYAIAALVAGWFVDRPAVVWVGPVLLLAVLWQAIVFRWTDALALELPRVTALVVHATVLIAEAALLVWFARGHVQLGTALRIGAAITSTAAAALLVAAITDISTTTASVYLAWLAAVWLALALLTGWQGIFALSQLATVLAIVAGVTAAVEARDWYIAAARPWLDPWFAEVQGIALSAYVLVMGGVRWFFCHAADERTEQVIESPPPVWYSMGARLLGPAWPAVDRVVHVALIGVFVAVATYAAMPGVGQELQPLEAARGSGQAVRVVTLIDEYQIASIDARHAGDGGAWLFGATVAAAIAVVMQQRRDREAWAVVLLVVVAMACPLLAARWQAEVAVASALRWFSAGFFVVASAVLWATSRRRSVLLDDVRVETLRNTLVTLVALVYVVLGVYVATSAVYIAGVSQGIGQWVPWVVGWVIVVGAAGMVVPLVGRRSAPVMSAAVTESSSAQPHYRSLQYALLLLAVCPLAIVGAFAVAAALDQHPFVGPDPASWFRRIGWDVTYGVPLALVAVGLVGHAIRDRSSGFAFAASLLANVVATIVVLIRVARSGGGLDATAWIVVAQVNAIVAGVAALTWLAAVRWSRSREPMLLVTQVALAAALGGTFLFPAAVRLAADPASGDAWLLQASGAAGWIALALAMCASGWLNWRQPVARPLVAFFVSALVALVALTSLRSDTGNWLAFHVLVVGLTAAAWLLAPLAAGANWLLGAGRLLQDGVDAAPLKWSSISARLFGVAAVVVALRALDGDPDAPWWTVGVLLALAARNVWVAWCTGGRDSMWLAALLANAAASIWWIDSGYRLTKTFGMGRGHELLWINVLAAAPMVVASVWIERLRIGRCDERSWQIRMLSFHRVAAWAMVLGMLAAAAANLAADFLNEAFPVCMPLGWAAWCAALVAVVVCWWDPRSRWPVACSYSVGLLAVALYLDGLDFQPPMFQWALALALASYSLATSFLWSRRREIGATLTRIGVVGAEEGTSGHGWLVTVNGLSAVAVVALVTWLEITMPEFGQRMIAACAVGAEALAVALLARGAVRSPLQYTSLVLGVLFAVAFGWAWLSPEMPAPWLHRIVAAIVALAATMVVYGLGIVKLVGRENEWTHAAVRLVPLLAVVAGVLLVAVLGIEVVAFAHDEPVPITWPALLAVAIALVGLAVAALVAALVPGRDPLGLSERGRTMYVYAAEVLLTLTFLHIRVTMPWLFSGWFARFWPLVVMVIAFVGVGVGEFFQRQRRSVLSEPLTTTGALLPLLPALGFWVVGSEVHYSLLLLTVGVLYAAVSVLRQSFWFAVLAALAANGSLWYLLYERQGLGITEHPQLWLIPPALCVLVAGYLNRARLTPQQSAALRYGAAIVIYASSTADIFINGVADAPWLPAVLAGLSILGVFAGILLRVRAFLYLGVTFLVVAIATVIWYAAIEQERTWILWVAGIVTGALIIALFGVFEKRRDDVLRVVDRLKQWET